MIYLIAPEHFYLFETLAVPQLTGFLKSEGFEVNSLVLDNYFYDNIITKEELQLSFEYIKNNKDNKQLKQEAFKIIQPFIKKTKLKSLYNFQSDEENFLNELYSKKDLIISSILKSKKRLDYNYLNLGKTPFLFNTANLQLGVFLFTIRWFPSTFRILEGYKGPINKSESNHLEKEIKDEELNYFIYYYNKYLFPKIKEPKLVGISFTHQSQLIPGFTLAYLIKKKYPECHITIGGALINQIKDSFDSKNELWNHIDSIVIGQGEKSISKLAKTIIGKKTLNNVPNIIYKLGNTIKHSLFDFEYDPNLIKLPIYGTKKPNPIIPFLCSYGCDWGKCKFCHFPHSAKGFSNNTSYQFRNIEEITKQLDFLIKKYNPSYIHLCDTNLNYKNINELSESLIKNEIKSQFYGFIRAEKAFLDISNCKKLRKSGFIAFHYGLESGSQRLLDNMHKGIVVSNVEKIIKNFKNSDIMNNLFLIVGLPGEYDEDLKKTIDFVKKNKNYIDGEIIIQRFYLDKNSEIEKYPGKFGLKINSEQGDLLTFVNFEKLNNQEVSATKENEIKTYHSIGIPVSYGEKFITQFLSKHKSKKYYPQFYSDVSKIWIQSRAISK